MLTLAELRRAVRALDAQIAGARLQRIVQSDDRSVVLSLYGHGVESHVLLTCRAGFARIATLEDSPPAPPSPPGFAQLLRARLRGAHCSGVRIFGEDRIAALHFEGSGGAHDLVLSILGPRSNLYLLDAEERLEGAIRPLEETRRDLVLGEPWSNPTSKPPSAGEDRWADVADDAYLDAVEAEYVRLETTRRRDELAQQIEQSLRRELQFLERREGKLSEDLASAKAATATRHQGELLKSVLHTVRAGDARAVATDYASGEEVVIALDPARSPAENLDRLFKRYQKAQKGALSLEQQLTEVRGRREVLARLVGDWDALGPEATIADLEAFAARRDVRAQLKKQTPRRGTRAPGPAGVAVRQPKPSGPFAKLPPRLRPKIYQGEDGFEIWVGRSDEGNDYLTTRLARGNDLFFHVESFGGSHVILRTGGRKDIPSGAMLDACELAVHFSKARDAGRADVHVAAIKDVKKPARAKAGLVQVVRGKSIHLRRDRARLQRLLDGPTDAADDADER